MSGANKHFQPMPASESTASSSQKYPSTDKRQPNSQSIPSKSLRARKLKLSSFGQSYVNYFQYYGATKPQTPSGHNMLNSTQPINFSSHGAAQHTRRASHQKKSSVTMDSSRNKITIDCNYAGTPTAYRTFSGMNAEIAYHKGVVMAQKFQEQKNGSLQKSKRGNSVANLLSAEANPQNMRQKWMRQSGSKVYMNQATEACAQKNSLHLIRQPGGSGLSNKQSAATKFFSPPLRQTRNLLTFTKDTQEANTTSKKAIEQSKHAKQEGQKDYRLILERQRKLIKELHSSSSKNGRKEESESSMREGASKRIHSFLQTHTQQPYVVPPALSPTAQAAAQIQEKHSKALNLTPKKENSRPNSQRGSPRLIEQRTEQVAKNSSNFKAESERAKQGERQTQESKKKSKEEEGVKVEGQKDVMNTPQIQHVKITYQNFINHPPKRSPRSLSSKNDQRKPEMKKKLSTHELKQLKPTHYRAATTVPEFEKKIEVAPAVPNTPDEVEKKEKKEEKQEEKIITIQDYLIGKQIGQGAYATVKLGVHRPSNKKVAVKIYEKYKLLDPQRRKSVRREIKLMEKLHHRNIIKLYEALDTSRQVLIVMEHMGGLSLHGLLKSRPNRQLPEKEARRLFTQVVEGIAFCHSKSVTHRDVKLENILLDEQGANLKIIDFGFSTCIPNDKKIKIFCGTPSYMAPEIVSRIEYAGPPADIWALGVLLFALLCGCFPFRGSNDKELYSKICSGIYNIPSHVPAGAALLLTRIFSVDPTLRPTAAQILRDPWIQYGSILVTKEERVESNHNRSRSSKPDLQSEKLKEQKMHFTENKHDFYTKTEEKESSKRAESAETTQPLFYNTMGGTQNIRHSGNTVLNHYNIINNITHINCPGMDSQKSDDLDLEIVSQLVKMGYRGNEIKTALKLSGSHIRMLYDKMQLEKKTLNLGIAPNYVPSYLSSLSPTSATSSFKHASALSNNWVRSGGAAGSSHTQERSKVDSLNLTEQNINLLGGTPFKTRNMGISDKENMSDYKGSSSKAHGRNKTMFSETVLQL